jgi:hypothetical protein
MKLHVVATTIEEDGRELICDIVLITTDELRADDLAMKVRNHLPDPCLDYSGLTPYTSCDSYTKHLDIAMGQPLTEIDPFTDQPGHIFEIYFSDLTPEAQARFLAALSLLQLIVHKENQEQCPLTILRIPEEKV